MTFQAQTTTLSYHPKARFGVSICVRLKMAMCACLGVGTNNNLIHDSLFVVDVKTDQHRIFPPSNKPQKCFIPKVMRFVAVFELN